MSEPGDERERLLAGQSAHPERVLGAHPDPGGGTRVRAYHPAACEVECVLEGGARAAMAPLGRGLFEAHVPQAAATLRHRFAFRFSEGHVWERGDPYRFAPLLRGDQVERLLSGEERRAHDVLGARPLVVEGVAGTAFATFAPGALRCSVVGDFCAWDARLLPMRAAGDAGLFELFVPDVGPGALYRFELALRDGAARALVDPFARERAGDVCSVARCAAPSGGAPVAGDPLRAPLAIYQVHLASWARVPEEGDRPLRYGELAPRLAEHARRFGFTHVLLAGLVEPGGFAADPRHGPPEELGHFVRVLHESALGVLLDWSPAGGVAGDAPGAARGFARSAALSSASFWLEEFGLDGLRLCGPDQCGPDEEALLRHVAACVRCEHPGVVLLGAGAPAHAYGCPFAERAALRALANGRPSDESLANGAACPVEVLAFEGGGREALLARLPGDEWQKFARLRLLATELWTRPVKKLLLMGTELAPWNDWSPLRSLDWHLAADPLRRGLAQLLEDLGALYRSQPCLWRFDGDPAGVRPLSSGEGPVSAYLRHDGDAHALMVLNAASEPHPGFRAGVPTAARYVELFSSDARRYGGSGFATRTRIDAEPLPAQGCAHSLRLDLPPLVAVVLVPEAVR